MQSGGEESQYTTENDKMSDTSKEISLVRQHLEYCFQIRNPHFV